MTTREQIFGFLDQFAPRELAEDWDNVGLLLGEPTGDVQRVLTCLTLTPDVAAEAIEQQVQCVITHHPILFRAVKRITTANSEGRMLLDLVRASVAVYSPHTRYDSAHGGINQQIAEGLKLADINPIRVLPDQQENASYLSGSGRWGKLSEPIHLEHLCDEVKRVLKIDQLQFVGKPDQQVQTIGIACGAAAEFLRDAYKLGCDAFITGEARFHSCLEARDLQVGMILPGHYATERHAMESLAEILHAEFPDVECIPSKVESDPVRWG